MRPRLDDNYRTTLRGVSWSSSMVRFAEAGSLLNDGALAKIALDPAVKPHTHTVALS